MPSAASPEFERFFKELGFRQDVVTALWDSNIQLPQELASLKTEELKEITKNPLLVNHFHPILQKNVHKIAMAKDPFKKARDVIKKHEDNNESENTTAADVKCDIEGRTGSASAGKNESIPITDTVTPVQQQGNTRSTEVAQYTAAQECSPSHSNAGAGTNMDRGRMARNQSSISITGGNFSQSNFQAQAAVTYNNTGTTVTAADSADCEDKKTPQSTITNEHDSIDVNQLKVSDFRWKDSSDYRLDNIQMEKISMETFVSHMENSEVYNIHGSGRALILNNCNFNHDTRLRKRSGADVDTRNMETALEKLGFQVEVAEDKRALEMKSHLEEFAKSKENIKADIVAVFIGSHGERDDKGNDTFLGCDGERVSFNDVKEMFGPKTAPLLKKKPKLFFLQFCRQVSDSVSKDGFESELPLPSEDQHAMDMLCAYATLAGTTAYRSETDGSWFVAALIKVLSENAHKDDLLSMLTKVNKCVSTNEGMMDSELPVQISEVVYNLRKKVYFFPGLED